MSNVIDDGKGDSDPCPLQYCDFKMVDHKTMCPILYIFVDTLSRARNHPRRSSSVTERLETLLAGANRRIRQIDSETKTVGRLGREEGQKSVRQRELEILNSLPSMKRSRPATEEKGAKRQKMEESRSTTVEPYCADITVEDQKFLEESLKLPDDELEYYKIPPLGKHYGEKWAQEDLLEEQEEGSRMQEKKLRGTLTNTTSDNTNKASEEKSLLKKADSTGLQEEDLCPFGSLTQRLVSALIEENIIAPIPEQNSGSGSSDSATTRSGNNPPRTPTKAPHVPHTRTLEARIREELVFQGLLDADDQTDEEVDDEVLAELKRHQNELRVLMTKNRQQKQDLSKLTQEEIRRQELKHRAEVADAEVMEWFRKIMACKQKRSLQLKKRKRQPGKL
ncbi:transcriptional adaptor 3 [Desmophyllum pertusum]|uniref:Transcriptional adaptor 3 n=1 Tax=Desmophyllum pertusum TaxID=174260 RepID=A0A9W9Z8R7_9CNID|nr:transcriptional adaptor 3 [Desmophyllum pertusum]